VAGSALAVIAQERPRIIIGSALKILNGATQWQSKKQKECQELLGCKQKGRRKKAL